MIFSDAGPDRASIEDTVDAFRDALGGLNPFVPENFDGGRRQIDWDAAPDAISDPNPFPGDFFNGDRAPIARGIEFQETGDTEGFALSSTEASGTPPTFGDPAFEVFSEERLFTPVGGNTFDVFFFDPANNDVPATSTGLGIIFSGVDDNQFAAMSFFDLDGMLLDLPGIDSNVLTAAEEPEGLSFIGVVFDDPVVAKVSVVSGSESFLSNGLFTESGGDRIVMDDFIFGEPTPVPVPPALAMLGTVLLGGAAWSRARRS